MTQYMILQGALTLRPDWKEFVKAPEAPSNYKKPEVIADYIRSKMETLESDVMQNCPSLLEVTDIMCACHKDLDLKDSYSVSEVILTALDDAIRRSDRLILIGEKPILSAYVSHPRTEDSVALRDLREAVWNSRITCSPLEDLRFTTAERKMLLTDKLMRQDPGEDFLAFAIREFSNWGIVYPDEWRIFREQ